MYPPYFRQDLESKKRVVGILAPSLFVGFTSDGSGFVSERRRTRLDRVTARRQTDAVHFTGKAFVLLPNMIRRA